MARNPSRGGELCLAPAKPSRFALENLSSLCQAFSIAGNAIPGYFEKKGEICGLTVIFNFQCHASSFPSPGIQIERDRLG